MTCGHLLDDWPEEPVLLLEAALILREESIEVMKEHLVENRALWMSGAVDSCHGKQRNSRNEPGGYWIP